MLFAFGGRLGDSGPRTLTVGKDFSKEAIYDDLWTRGGSRAVLLARRMSTIPNLICMADIRDCPGALSKGKALIIMTPELGSTGGGAALLGWRTLEKASFDVHCFVLLQGMKLPGPALPSLVGSTDPEHLKSASLS